MAPAGTVFVTPFALFVCAVTNIIIERVDTREHTLSEYPDSNESDECESDEREAGLCVG